MREVEVRRPPAGNEPDYPNGPWLDLLSSIGEPAGLLNQRREFTAANAGLLALLGLTGQELVGRRIGDSVHCLNTGATPAGCGSGSSCRDCGANIAILRGQAGIAASEDCRWRLPVGSGECFVDVCIWTFPVKNHPHWTLFLVPEDSSHERRQSIATAVANFVRDGPLG